MPRLRTNDLLWLALLGLDELAKKHRDTPAEPTFLLRFALAFVWQASGADPSKRWVFDRLWKDLLSPEQTGEMARYMRARDVDSGMKGVCNVIGWNFSILDRAEEVRERTRRRE